MSTSGSTTAAWIGPLPPPVHGASLVTARLLERVREHIEDVRVVDVAGKGDGIGHIVSRARAHVRALLVVLGLPAGAVVYVSLFGGFGLWYQVPVLALARLRGLRVVAHHHSYAYISARAVPMVLITRLLGAGDRHLFLSASMREAFLGRYASRADHRVVSNAHVVEPCPAPTTSSASRPTRDLALVHVSNLSVSKGSVAAVETCEVLRRRDARVGLTLVGPCGDDETSTAIAAAGNAVQWLGPCSTVDVNKALDSADVFLFPSSYVNEAEPLVVLEALSRGVPVIATRRGALPELLPADWLVESPDPEEIAARVETLCSRPSWRAEAAERARALFAARRADADPIELVLEKTSPTVSVLQVLPTFEGTGVQVAAALEVSESYAGVAGTSLWTVGGGTPGAEWVSYQTVAPLRSAGPDSSRPATTSSWSLAWWLVRHVRAFDLVHVHARTISTASWLSLLARLCGTPYVLQTHGTVARRSVFSVVDMLLTGPALRRARAVCVESDVEREQVLARAPQAAVVLVPAASPARRIVPSVVGATTGSRLVLAVSGQTPEGIDRFFDVVEHVGLQQSDVEVDVLAGVGADLAKVRERAARSTVPVAFHDPQDRERRALVMSRAVALLHTEPEESIRLSILEAFAAGVPVVAAQSGRLADLLSAEGAALLPSDEVGAWSTAVRRVLDDPTCRDRLRAGGRAVLDLHVTRASVGRVPGELVDG